MSDEEKERRSDVPIPLSIEAIEGSHSPDSSLQPCPGYRYVIATPSPLYNKYIHTYIPVDSPVAVRKVFRNLEPFSILDARFPR